MSNTTRKLGKNDTKTFIKAVNSKSAVHLLEVLDIRDDATNARAVALVGDLMDITGDNPESPLYRAIDIISAAIERYEADKYPLKRANPVETLKYFMEAHDLNQTDLADIFGSQGNLSQILKGERDLNLKHAHKLAERFKVSPDLFV